MRATVVVCVCALVAGAAFADLFVVGSKSGRAEYPWYGC
jgi:hypothetical protein